MTHNGQDDEPSARPAHEGIVLPSDGGEPLLPGQTGDRAVPAGGQAWDQPWGPGPAQGASPEPGQGWTPTGEWGSAGQDQGAQAPGWGTPHADQGGAAPASEAPPQISSWTAPAPDAGAQPSGWAATPSGPEAQGGPGTAAPGAGAQGGYAGQPSQYGAQGTAGGPQAPNDSGWLPPQTAGAGSVPEQRSGPGTPLPHEGAPANGYGAPQTPGPYAPGNTQTQGPAGPHTPGDYSYPQAHGAQAAPQPHAGHAVPQQGGPAGSQAPGGFGPPQGLGGQAAPQPSAGQQQGGPAGPQGPGGYGYPQGPGGQTPAPYAPGGQTAAPLPPVGPGAGALPPVAAVDEGATQYLPPVPASPSGDEGATQLLPPVGPGALPPETPPAGAAPAGMSSESTRYLGRVRPDGPGPASGGPGPLPAAVDPDAQPTQFIAPVPAQPGAAQYGVRPGVPEDRQQPPAEFDNLFRADAGGSTQQLPRVDQPRARQGAPAGFGSPNRPGVPGAPGGPGVPEGPTGRGARRGAADGDNGRGGRTRSRVPVIAAVGVGIAVLGIGAGALLSGGGDDKGDDNKTVAATGPATDESASASADPAKEQAVALDKLLADSGDSRDSVVKAVGNVRKCASLGQAATDLRDAAKQRDGLVTSLGDLSVDKLPNHAQLTAALNSAWKASSAADTHYAAWADQTAGKKGCRKGQARNTGQTAAGNRESGTATTQKAKAAKLWNSIAQTYGLTERQPGQL